MLANDDEDDEWNDGGGEDEQPQGYQALLDPDDEQSEHDDEEEEVGEETIVEENESDHEQEDVPVDDGQIKPFSCQLCSVFFSKFEGYREHFVSTEHRYKRRDEKKRLGVCYHLYSFFMSLNNILFLGRMCH